MSNQESIQKARELLKEIKGVAQRMKKKCYEGSGVELMKSRTMLIQVKADHALSLLAEQPVCKTHGKIVTDPTGIHTCQQQPAGEFTKKVREYMKKQGVRSVTERISWQETLNIVGQGGKYLYEACDLIESLVKELKLKGIKND